MSERTKDDLLKDACELLQEAIDNLPGTRPTKAGLQLVNTTVPQYNAWRTDYEHRVATFLRVVRGY